MEERKGNNEVFVIGEATRNFRYSHDVRGQKFYETELAVPRVSGVVDCIMLIISETMIDLNKDYTGEFLAVTGEYRSCRKTEGEKSHVVLYLSASDFKVVTEEEDVCAENNIYLDGYICKKTNFRVTKAGHEIMDGIVAVNRPGFKSDYIPCIFWNQHAIDLKNMSIGTHIRLTGRIQSRDYIKYEPDGEIKRTAYEVSVKEMHVIENTLLKNHTMVAVM